jgi:hypothetical protein
LANWTNRKGPPVGRISSLMSCVIVVLSATGCHSLAGSIVDFKPDYTTLPEADLRAVAAEIEAAVQAGNRESSIPDRGGITLNTDAIKQAIRTRAARAQLLNDFLDTGHCWERQDGLIWVIRSSEYKKFGKSRDRDRNALLIDSENANRWAIYEGIIDASKLSPKALPAVRAIFAEARVANMKAGQKYESSTGEAATK